MLSKKEMGMIALAGVGVVGIGYFMGDSAGEGGGLRAGQILGSPGGIAAGLPSAGTSSVKLATAKKLTKIPFTVTAKPSEVTGGYPVKVIKSAFGKQAAPTSFVTPGYVPEAATQAYISKAGGYVAPTFEGVGGKIIGGRYTPPAGLYPSKTQAGLTKKGLATQAKVFEREIGRAPSTSGLTAKGEATKKRVAERKARSK